jgi:hypothetical protein
MAAFVIERDIKNRRFNNQTDTGKRMVNAIATQLNEYHVPNEIGMTLIMEGIM